MAGGVSNKDASPSIVFLGPGFGLYFSAVVSQFPFFLLHLFHYSVYLLLVASLDPN